MACTYGRNGAPLACSLGREPEPDASHFGAGRGRDKCNRGASGKTITFGLLKRSEVVYPRIMLNVLERTLHGNVRIKSDIASVNHTDGWRRYDGLVDIGFDKLTFVLHLNECEFRFNHRLTNVYRASLELMREYLRLPYPLPKTQYKMNVASSNS